MRNTQEFIISIVLCLIATLFVSAQAHATDLTVSFPTSPLFTMTNSFPGQSITKQFTVKNTAASAKTVAIKIKNVTQTEHLSQALFVTISDGITPLYGGSNSKTLNQFMTDSQNLFGVPLSSLSSQEQKTYSITLLFDPQAGNDYKNASLSFGLSVGLSIEIPALCLVTTFLPTPILGTSKNDQLFGTAGNDLIIGFEGGDIIHGNGGIDCIIGGTGNDVLYGDNGSDFVFGQEGSDIIYGGRENDYIDGGSGFDILFGELGNDILSSRGSLSVIDGGVGTDSCTGSIFKFSCEN